MEFTAQEGKHINNDSRKINKEQYLRVIGVSVYKEILVPPLTKSRVFYETFQKPKWHKAKSISHSPKVGNMLLHFDKRPITGTVVAFLVKANIFFRLLLVNKNRY